LFLSSPFTPSPWYSTYTYRHDRPTSQVRIFHKMKGNNRFRRRWNVNDSNAIVLNELKEQGSTPKISKILENYFGLQQDKRERERQTLPSFVVLFVFVLFFCFFGGFLLSRKSPSTASRAHTQERREMKTSSGWSNARGQRKECQTSDCDGVLSGSVRRPLVANTTNYRRLLNCSGTAKLEKFPQTDSQTDKARRQVYEQHVNVADPVVPLFIKNAWRKKEKTHKMKSVHWELSIGKGRCWFS
jgi:hypothetical protein